MYGLGLPQNFPTIHLPGVAIEITPDRGPTKTSVTSATGFGAVCDPVWIFAGTVRFRASKQGFAPTEIIMPVPCCSQTVNLQLTPLTSSKAIQSMRHRLYLTLLVAPTRKSIWSPLSTFRSDRRAPSIRCARLQTLTSARTSSLLKLKGRRPGERVATVETFTEDQTAGVLSLQKGGAWQSVRGARVGRAGGATGVQNG
jgi:hypothetical protein